MDSQLQLPIPISAVQDKYLLFDIVAAMYVRREHRMCGAMVGSLPQSPQQNVFLGLPIEIMPEEAQLLVEKGIAYIVNDIRAHDRAIASRDAEREAEYLSKVKRHGQKAAEVRTEQKEEQKKQALKKISSSKNASVQKHDTPSLLDFDDNDGSGILHRPDSLVTSQQTQPSPNDIAVNDNTSFAVTPSTSSSLLPNSSATPALSSSVLPNLPTSYPLYRHLQQRSYFMTPGLRFGCQYTVYPGDPLRFHSHFLAVGTQWDEEIDLMDIVGGGRLGTGVKKGYLFGGEDDQGKVRTFSVEWAAM